MAYNYSVNLNGHYAQHPRMPTQHPHPGSNPQSSPYQSSPQSQFQTTNQFPPQAKPQYQSQFMQSTTYTAAPPYPQGIPPSHSAPSSFHAPSGQRPAYQHTNTPTPAQNHQGYGPSEPTHQAAVPRNSGLTRTARKAVRAVVLKAALRCLTSHLCY